MFYPCKYFQRKNEPRDLWLHLLVRKKVLKNITYFHTLKADYRFLEIILESFYGRKLFGCPRVKVIKSIKMRFDGMGG